MGDDSSVKSNTGLFDLRRRSDAGLGQSAKKEKKDKKSKKKDKKDKKEKKDQDGRQIRKHHFHDISCFSPLATLPLGKTRQKYILLYFFLFLYFIYFTPRICA